MKVAIGLHIWPTIGLRLQFGSHHKLLFDSYKTFYTNLLQNYNLDLKSLVRKGVRVRVPPRLVCNLIYQFRKSHFRIRILKGFGHQTNSRSFGHTGSPTIIPLIAVDAARRGESGGVAFDRFGALFFGFPSTLGL